MRASHLIFTLLLLSAWSVSCFPSKPLNERSAELTWQAWLLIDESQNKQQQDNTLRRRITPKSVFIAPTFNPDNLPECSEGYRSDSMGRCIKIIMLNKELHLDFLLQQLNQKFGGLEDYEEEEEVSTNGPLNINIPLAAEIQEETDVAIVVAPTLDIQQQNTSEIKFNKTITDEKVNVEEIAGILGLRKAAEVETTTITPPSTIPDTTTQETTTKAAELNALFFLDPKKQVAVKLETAETTTLISTTITELDNNDYPLLQMDQALPYVDTLVPFADRKREIDSTTTDSTPTTDSTTTTELQSTTTLPEDNFNTQSTTVLPVISTPPPNTPATTPIYPTSTYTPATTTNSEPVRFPTDLEEASRRFEEIFNHYKRGADLADGRKHTFTTTDHPQSPYQRFQDQKQNHRNRDRNSEWFTLPTKWSDSSQKPVVLRFSRKHGYIDSQQLGSTNFYREINPRLFGFRGETRRVLR